MRGPVVVLAGGTGGAKLARGMLDITTDLTVIANTGDDIEIYGGHVSPDPDLICFWLADAIDRRGWGLEGDTFHVMNGLRELGEEVWFNLGDRDLAIAHHRAQLLRAGARLTDAHRLATAALPPATTATTAGADRTARVLPMSDQPVRTRILAQDRWWTMQEFMIRSGGQGPVAEVQFRGARTATATPEVLRAIEEADVIVIGPSNPVLSIGPMLAIPTLQHVLRTATAPVVAVSPIVGGAVLKGPTAACMRWRGEPATTAGVAALYDGLIDGLVADEPCDGLPTLATNLLLSTAADRARLAAEVIAFAERLPRSRAAKPVPCSAP